MIEILLIGGLALVAALSIADAIAPRERAWVVDPYARHWPFACTWAGV